MHRILNILGIFAIAFVVSSCGKFANTVEGATSVPTIGTGTLVQGLPNANGVPKPSNPGGYAFSPSPVTIDEILADPTGSDAGNQYIELFNQTGSIADIGGWVIANGTDSYTFPFGFKVNAGERVVLHVSMAGSNTATDHFAPSFQVLDSSKGSIALLRSGNDLVDFVQWGQSGLSFEQAADLVAEWQTGDFTLVAPEGSSLDYDGGSNQSSAWHVTQITPGS